VWGEESLLAARGVHAREGERGERESAGGETCPMRGRAGVGRGGPVAMGPVQAGGGEPRGEGRLLAMRPVPGGGGRAWGEGSLLAVRPVRAGEGGRGERGVCWR